MERNKVIALCGDASPDAFLREQKRLARAGVISVFAIGEEDNEQLRHSIILMADEMLIINDDGCIHSEQTKSEIRYAQRVGRRIRFLKEPPEEWMKYSYEWEDFHALPFDLRQAVRGFWKPDGRDYTHDSEIWNDMPDNGMPTETFKKAVYMYDSLLSRLRLDRRRCE